jgi:hypothetical protein
MKKVILVLVLLVTIPLTRAFSGTEHHIKANLAPEGGSGVTGFVELTQLPHGGTNIHIVARGLQAGTVYASFYYESPDCSAPADLLATFTGNTGGTGEVHGKIDDDLEDVGSVSVRLGPGYGTLLACATVH